MIKKQVNANYEIMATFKNVKLKVPNKNDKHLKFIAEHQIINGNQEIVGIPNHYRRGDIFDGNFLTRRFYIDPSLLGTIIVADEVRIVSKIDLVKNQVCLIIDIIKQDLNEIKPQYILKCGSPLKGENSFQIPGTDKQVSFLSV